MSFLKGLTLALVLLQCGSCRNDMDRAEVIDRVRGLGASLSEGVITPSTDTVNFITATIYVALPKGRQLTLSAFKDTKQGLYHNLDSNRIVIDEASLNYDEYSSLQIASFNVRLEVPKKLELTGFRRVKYALEARSGDDSELLLGTFEVSEQAEDRADPLEIEVLKPVADSSYKKDQEVAMESLIDNPNSDSTKLAWFVTGGEVQNRRAYKTIWTPKKSGPHTIIFTARGVYSRTFAYRVIDVEVE